MVFNEFKKEVNMITRGYFIGEIIDQLTGISEQIKTRSKFGLLDINRYAEDFFKEIINIIFGYNLKNLNEGKLNTPGLDLGDIEKQIAYQITSTNIQEKICDTLKKAKKYHENEYKTIYIFILTNKKTYKLDNKKSEDNDFKSACLHFSFEETQHVLDMNDLLKTTISLPLDKLQKLYDLISKNICRLTIDLEIPDANGNYQTDLKNYIEDIPTEKFEGIDKYILFYNKQYSSNSEIKPEDLKTAFEKLIFRLKNLPRITRQFLAFLIERSEFCEKSDAYSMEYPYFDRICNFPKKEEEIDLLRHYKFCYIGESDNETYNGKQTYIIYTSLEDFEHFTLDFMDYIKQHKLLISKIIVDLDFTDFHQK